MNRSFVSLALDLVPAVCTAAVSAHCQPDSLAFVHEFAVVNEPSPCLIHSLFFRVPFKAWLDSGLFPTIRDQTMTMRLCNRQLRLRRARKTVHHPAQAAVQNLQQQQSARTTTQRTLAIRRSANLTMARLHQQAPLHQPRVHHRAQRPPSRNSNCRPLVLRSLLARRTHPSSKVCLCACLRTPSSTFICMRLQNRGAADRRENGDVR